MILDQPVRSLALYSARDKVSGRAQTPHHGGVDEGSSLGYPLFLSRSAHADQDDVGSSVVDSLNTGLVLLPLSGMEAMIGLDLQVRMLLSQRLGSFMSDPGLSADPVETVSSFGLRCLILDPVGAGHSLGDLFSEPSRALDHPVSVAVAQGELIQEDPQL